jgi:hypothetical protein
MSDGWMTYRSKGMCGWCGKPPSEGRSMCDACRLKNRIRNNASRVRVKALGPKPAKDLDIKLSIAGRCPRCELLLPCGPCLPTAREMAEARRDAE